jgi:dTDP-4-dehydrorhamnose reductase
MRALILGGTGMLGRAVMAEVRHRGGAALAPSRQQVDITHLDRVIQIARAFRPRVIVNCAAFTQVDACEEREAEATAVNGAGAGNAAEAAAAVGARLIQVSTDYIFDGTQSSPYSEDATPAPRSAYGRSKLAGEEAVRGFEKALIVRVSWLFGPGGPSFPATMVRLMEGGHRTLRVVDDQVGGPTYTPFLARALCDLAKAEAAGVVHYQNREAVSWYDFTREIVRLWDPTVDVVPVTTAEFPRPAPRPAYSVLDVHRCEEILQRRVEPWSAGLAEFLGFVGTGPTRRMET